MDQEQMKRVKIAYLYHTDDQAIFETLYRHLAGLRRDGLIEESFEALAGTEIQEVTKVRLQEAQVIILLLSSSFENADLYSGPEMVAHIRRCAEKGSCVWRIIARVYHLGRSVFQEYELLFGDENRSIATTQPPEVAYKRITESIDHKVAHMLAQAWTEEGDRYSHCRKLPEALSAYEQSLGYVSDYLPALLGKLRILYKQGNVEEARHCFDALISSAEKLKQNLKEITCRPNLRKESIGACCKGYALLLHKQPFEALEAFQAVYQQLAPPQNELQRQICAEAYCGAGDAYLALSQCTSTPRWYREQALAAYLRANESWNDGVYLARIGKGYGALGFSNHNRYEQALQIYQQVIQLCPNYAPAYTGQGEIFYRQRRFKDALAAYEQALLCDPYEADAHGGRGYTLLTLNNPTEAVQAFEEALLLDEHNAGFYYGKGCAQAKLERHEEALSAYTMARNLGLNSTQLFVSWAATLLKLGDAAYRYGHSQQASQYYQDAVEAYRQALDKGWWEQDRRYYSLGKYAFSSKNWQQALQHYQEAIDLAPHKADIYVALGLTLIELGHTSEAFNSFKEAQLRSHHAASMTDATDIEVARGDAYRRLAERSQDRERYTYQAKARECYEKAITMQRHVAAYLGLAKTYIDLHYYTEAIETLDRILQIKPELSECYFLKGKCYHALGQLLEAHSLYQTAHTHGLDTPALLQALGEILLAMKRYNEAIRVFERVIEQGGEEVARAACGKSIALHQLGLDEDALHWFKWAHRLNYLICLEDRYRCVLQNIFASIEKKLYTHRSEASLYICKGDILLLLGERNEEAIDAYTTAIAWGEHSADLYACRGEAYERLGKYRKALKDYRAALKIDSAHQWAWQGKERVEMEIVQKNMWRNFTFWKRLLF